MKRPVTRVVCAVVGFIFGIAAGILWEAVRFAMTPFRILKLACMTADKCWEGKDNAAE